MGFWRWGLGLSQLPIGDPAAMQARWKSQLDPLLANDLVQGTLVSGVSLSSGDNSVTHKLGRAPKGWILTDINAAVTVYRSKDFSDTTLTLNASGTATVSLWVF